MHVRRLSDAKPTHQNTHEGRRRKRCTDDEAAAVAERAHCVWRLRMSSLGTRTSFLVRLRDLGFVECVTRDCRRRLELFHGNLWALRGPRREVRGTCRKSTVGSNCAKTHRNGAFRINSKSYTRDIVRLPRVIGISYARK